MKISRNWLKEYIDISESNEELADMLTYLGFEVEETTVISHNFDGIVTGFIEECIQHPNADKLSLCKVNIGADSSVQIACGASNVAQGQFVPVATVGAVLESLILPNGKPLKIEKRKLRGEVSEGMICAEDELGLSEDHSGIMVFTDKPTPGTPLSDYLALEDDVVFEIGLTPNRPDAACHFGIAREISAKTGREIKSTSLDTKKYSKVDSIGSFKVEIKNPELCHRYMGIRIENVSIKTSPQWLKNRLNAIGLRPINNVVDATNYILHTYGQPLHAFDADLIRGEKIIVQSFDHSIDFVTLDSVKREVAENSLFICDGEGPVAIAGIMGGENSEISDSTTNVLLEGAYFFPQSVRQTSKQTALQTDASYRFERGIDPANTHIYTWKCAELIAQLTGGTIINEYVDEHPTKFEAPKISFRPKRCTAILGIEVSDEDQKKYLTSLGIDVDSKSSDSWICIPPSHRVDLEREIDLIEEVARLIDYNAIPRPEFQSFLPATIMPKTEILREKVREFMVRLGYNEIYSNSLLPEHDSILNENTVRTMNPISKDQSLLRENLEAGLLKAISFNQKRKQGNLQLFEMGHVFAKSEDSTYVKGVKEIEHLSFAISGEWISEDWNHKAELVAFKHLRSSLQSLFSALKIDRQVEWSFESSNTVHLHPKNDDSKSNLGSLSKIGKDSNPYFELNSDVYFASLNLNAIFELVLSNEDHKYQAPSKFPEIEFDLALVMPRNTAIAEITSIIEDASGVLLTSISTFDVYEGKNIGEGLKSVAFKMFFRNPEKTLTIDEVQPIIDRIVNQANQKFGAYLRT